MVPRKTVKRRGTVDRQSPGGFYAVVPEPVSIRGSNTVRYQGVECGGRLYCFLMGQDDGVIRTEMPIRREMPKTPRYPASLTGYRRLSPKAVTLERINGDVPQTGVRV